VIKTELLKNGPLNRTRMTVDTGKMPFCGTQFSLHRQAEFDGTPEFPDRNARQFSVTLIDME